MAYDRESTEVVWNRTEQRASHPSHLLADQPAPADDQDQALGAAEGLGAEDGLAGYLLVVIAVCCVMVAASLLLLACRIHDNRKRKRHEAREEEHAKRLAAYMTVLEQQHMQQQQQQQQHQSTDTGTALTSLQHTPVSEHNVFTLSSSAAAHGPVMYESVTLERLPRHKINRKSGIFGRSASSLGSSPHILKKSKSSGNINQLENGSAGNLIAELNRSFHLKAIDIDRMARERLASRSTDASFGSVNSVGAESELHAYGSKTMLIREMELGGEEMEITAL